MLNTATMEKPSKRKRTEITIGIKKAICLHKKDHAKISQDRLVQFVKDTYSIDVGRSTISDILKQSDKWMAYDESNKTERKSTRITQTKHAELEDALFLWHTNALTHNVAISDEILLTKAEQLGKELGVTDLSYSRGWLTNFKKRHNICLREKHGESASSDKQAATEGRSQETSLLFKWI